MSFNDFLLWFFVILVFAGIFWVIFTYAGDGSNPNDLSGLEGRPE